MLTRYFNTSDYRSFLRQLNFYGFIKGRTKKDKLIFRHQDFIRGQEDRLLQVQKILKKSESTRPKKSDKPPILKEIQRRIKKLRDKNSGLTQQLGVKLAQIKYLFEGNGKVLDEIIRSNRDFRKGLQLNVIANLVPLIDYQPFSAGVIDRALYQGQAELSIRKKMLAVPTRTNPFESDQPPKRAPLFNPEFARRVLTTVIHETTHIENKPDSFAEAAEIARKIESCIDSRLSLTKPKSIFPDFLLSFKSEELELDQMIEVRSTPVTEEDRKESASRPRSEYELPFRPTRRGDRLASPSRRAVKPT